MECYCCKEQAIQEIQASGKKMNLCKACLSDWGAANYDSLNRKLEKKDGFKRD